MNNNEFVALVEELKAGNNTRLKLIFETHSAYCINKLISNHQCTLEEAEDIYMDSIINFRDKILSGKLEILTDLKSYLFATCKNMLLVKLKKEQRVNKAVLEIYDDKTYEIDDDDLFSDPSYQEKILSVMNEAFSFLNENCQKILRAFYFERLSLDEIAEKYGLANANVVKVSKSRCFQKLVGQIKTLQNSK